MPGADYNYVVLFRERHRLDLYCIGLRREPAERGTGRPRPGVDFRLLRRRVSESATSSVCSHSVCSKLLGIFRTGFQSRNRSVFIPEPRIFIGRNHQLSSDGVHDDVVHVVIKFASSRCAIKRLLLPYSSLPLQKFINRMGRSSLYVSENAVHRNRIVFNAVQNTE